MTAAEAAASIAAQTQAAQAAYNKGTLFSPGALQVGQTLESLTPGKNLNTKDPTGLLAGSNDLVQLNPTAMKLQAGYYTLPGKSGAEYFDPSGGGGMAQASSEFVKWANSLTPDDLSLDTGQPSNFIPVEGGPEAVNASKQMSGQALVNFNSIIAAGRGADGTYQDSQDRTLGIGKYQQFVTGPNGEQLRLSDVMAKAAGPAPVNIFKDVSPYASKGVSTEVGSSGGFWQADTGGKQWIYTNPLENYKTNEADAIAASAAINQHNQDAYAGLTQERIIAAATAAGEDPGNALKAAMSAAPGSAEATSAAAIANTGISSAQTKQIYDTYNSILDPTEKAAYIAGQDPGNLTSSERVAQTAAKQGQTNWMLKNAIGPKTQWSGDPYGAGGGVKTTVGDVTMTDKITGRSTVWGNVPTAQEYVGAASRGAFDQAMNRLGGGLYGAFIGYIGSFGNPIGAVVGAASGSGALGGINFKNPGKTTWGASEKFQGVGSVALSMGEAMAFSYFGVGDMGAVGRIGVGIGMGSANGFMSGGTKGIAVGGISGGVGGYFAGNNGPSWAQKASNAYQMGA